MITAEQYNHLKAISERFKAWLGNRTCYKQGECPEDCQITNEERSAIELYQWHQNPPTEYTAYITSDMSYITTWLGDKLGRVTYHSSRNRQGRVSIVVMGDNGIRYYGTHYPSSGDYCKLKAYKRS